MRNATDAITIGGRIIGPNHPVYIVAEMSANHNQDFGQAVKILHAAKEAGADAVKLQTYTPDTLTIDCDNEHFVIGAGTIWEGRKLYDLYSEACTPWEWQPRLKELADGMGMDLFSTPFDHTSVDFLESLAMPAYKIASFELVDLPLIRRVAETGKPMILSTGMATEEEIDEAIRAARGAGATQVALLKCTSAYPAPYEEMNLRTIPYLSEKYGIPVGLSDHTEGTTAPVAAVALGASLVEKHFCLSRAIPGPDSSFSLEPQEFAAMVQAVRATEKALGEAICEVTRREAASRVFRRSLFAVSDVKAGEVFTEKNVRSIRPGFGLAPKYISSIIGSCAAQAIPRGTPLSWELVQGGAAHDTLKGEARDE